MTVSIVAAGVPRTGGGGPGTAMAAMLPSMSMTAPPSNDGSNPTSNSIRWSIFPPRREFQAGPASCTLPQIAAGPRRERPITAMASPTRNAGAGDVRGALLLTAGGAVVPPETAGSPGVVDTDDPPRVDE